MRPRPNIYIPGVTAPTYVQKLAEQVPLALAMIGVVVVLLATLFPFDFYSYRVNGFSWDLSRHLWGDRIYDFVTNVVLFLPLGLGIAARVMHGQFGRRLWSVIAAAVSGLILSTIVENVQCFLPRRDPSLVDIISNTTGALIGGLFIWHWGEIVMRRLPLWLSDEMERPAAAKFGAALIFWLAWPIALAIYFAGSLSLNNWNPTAQLLIGNEPQGNRQWMGRVAELRIVSRALDQQQVEALFSGQPISTIAGDDLLASYTIAGEHDYPDETGHQPELKWFDAVTLDDTGQPVFTYGRWLMTSTAPLELSRTLRDSDAFTLVTTAATDDPFQGNDARIVSLSRTSLSRNLTLAQNETDLVIRIRNGITGNNGDQPQFLIPDVFSDTAMHRIVVSYQHGVIHAWVDRSDLANQIRLTPAAALIWRSFPRPAWALRLGSIPILIHAWLLYLIIFIPTAMLIAILSTLVRHRYRPWLFISGIIAPPIILQCLFAWPYALPFNLTDTAGTLVISLGVGVITLLRLKAWRRIVVSTPNG